MVFRINLKAYNKKEILNISCVYHDYSLASFCPEKPQLLGNDELQ